MYPNLDDLNILQMSVDHESLKIYPKDKRLVGNVNMYNANLKDH